MIAFEDGTLITVSWNSIEELFHAIVRYTKRSSICIKEFSKGVSLLTSSDVVNGVSVVLDSISKGNASLNRLHNISDGNCGVEPAAYKPVIQGPGKGDVELQNLQHPKSIHVQNEITWS
jgi:hypothetical protein